MKRDTRFWISQMRIGSFSFARPRLIDRDSNVNVETSKDRANINNKKKDARFSSAWRQYVGEL